MRIYNENKKADADRIMNGGGPPERKRKKYALSILESQTTDNKEGINCIDMAIKLFDEDGGRASQICCSS